MLLPGQDDPAARTRREVSVTADPRPPFAAVTTAEAKPERILGPNWPTLSVKQVEQRAEQLTQVSNFAWLVAQSMRERQAPNAGSVLVLASTYQQETLGEAAPTGVGSGPRAHPMGAPLDGTQVVGLAS